METSERQQVSSLDLLQKYAEEINFYQAVRMLESSVRDENHDRRIRFKATHEQAFLPNFVGDVKVQKDEALVKVNGYGLAGQQGPLPDVYADMLFHERSKGNFGPSRFVDLFNNRLVHLLYDIKKELDPMLFNQAAGDSILYKFLESATGLKTTELFERLPITAEKLMTFAALLVGNRQNYSSLKLIIETMFDCEVEIDSCKGAWRELPERLQTKIGSQDAVLGSGIGLGKKHWDNQAAIGLTLKLKNIEQCREIMPRGTHHDVFKSIVAFLTDGKYDIDVQLILDWENIPESKMHSTSSMHLGQSSWMKATSALHKTLNLPKFKIKPALKTRYWSNAA